MTVVSYYLFQDCLLIPTRWGISLVLRMSFNRVIAHLIFCTPFLQLLANAYVANVHRREDIWNSRTIELLPSSESVDIWSSETLSDASAQPSPGSKTLVLSPASVDIYIPTATTTRALCSDLGKTKLSSEASANPTASLDTLIPSCTIPTTTAELPTTLTSSEEDSASDNTDLIPSGASTDFTNSEGLSHTATAPCPTETVTQTVTLSDSSVEVSDSTDYIPPSTTTSEGVLSTTITATETFSYTSIVPSQTVTEPPSLSESTESTVLPSATSEEIVPSDSTLTTTETLTQTATDVLPTSETEIVVIPPFTTSMQSSPTATQPPSSTEISAERTEFTNSEEVSETSELVPSTSETSSETTMEPSETLTQPPSATGIIVIPHSTTSNATPSETVSQSLSESGTVILQPTDTDTDVAVIPPYTISHVSSTATSSETLVETSETLTDSPSATDLVGMPLTKSNAASSESSSDTSIEPSETVSQSLSESGTVILQPTDTDTDVAVIPPYTISHVSSTATSSETLVETSETLTDSPSATDLVGMPPITTSNTASSESSSEMLSETPSGTVILIPLDTYVAKIPTNVTRTATSSDTSIEPSQTVTQPLSDTSTQLFPSTTLSTFSEPPPLPSPTPVPCTFEHGDCISQVDAPWYLQRISQDHKLEFRDMDNYYKELGDGEWRYSFPHDPNWGEDVIVYTVDSGVNLEHSAFDRDQFEDGAHISKLDNDNDRTPHTDQFNLGTSVASLIVGKINGVARKTRIFPIKLISTTEGEVENLDVLEGVNIAINDWKTRRQNNKLRAIIHISLPISHHPHIETAFKSALHLGMHVVHGSGDKGAHVCHEDTHEGHPQRIVKNVGQIIVSGMLPYLFNTIEVRDKWYNDGNDGSCVDITAPAAFVWTADTNRLDYGMRKGTVYGASLVTGAMAALLSSGSPYRNLNPAKFKEVFLRDFTMNGLTNVPPGTTDKMLMIKKFRSDI